VLFSSFDPERLEAALDTASVLFAVPAIYERLEPGPGLRLAVSGSAPLSARLAERLAARLGELPLERYGSTEAGLNLSNLLDGPRRAGAVGFPLPGVEARVGEADELLVRGPQVFSGYHHREQATAEAFADGWFRTGDVASVDGDGCFAITGRLKELIVSGGLNVYPAEVERTLEEHPAVARAAVAGVPSERWGEEVVAFAVAGDGAQLDGAALIAFCRERLSAYKCPKRVVALPELPVNRMGKVRREALVEAAAREHAI
jgi:malonyl-CoA/methylmalonyl-CoA synthetase